MVGRIATIGLELGTAVESMSMAIGEDDESFGEEEADPGGMGPGERDLGGFFLAITAVMHRRRDRRRWR